MFFKARNKYDYDALKNQIDVLKHGFESSKEELEDHLQSINENTSELDMQNSFICEIDNRMTKMEEKMDELHFLLKQMVRKAQLSVGLSKDEQRVFLILYTHEKFMKPDAISEKALLETETVQDALGSMSDKGIPVEREILDGKVYFRMNPEFKLRQAKEQIIKIDSEVTGQYQNTLLKQFFQN